MEKLEAPNSARARDALRRERVPALWAQVTLDPAIVASVSPDADAASSRGDALPLEAPEWIVHSSRIGRDRKLLAVIRLWFPRFVGPTYQDESRARYGDEVATAALLFIRERLSTYTGSNALSAIYSFIAYDKFLEVAAPWVGAASGDFSRRTLNAFARWCEAQYPGHPDVYPRLLAAFVVWAARFQLFDLDQDDARAATRVRIRSRVAGHIARVGHPTKGALIEQERQSVLTSLDNPHPEHHPLDRALVRLCWEVGPRPVQVAALTWGALLPRDSSGVAKIRIPRAKSRRPDSRFSDRTVSQSLYTALAGLRPRDADNDTPMFRVTSGADVTQLLQRWSRLHDLVTTRPPRRTFGRRPFRSYRRSGLKVWRLRLTPYRLRRTLATRLAEAGAGAATIVAALDDDTLAMATVYAANSSSLVETLKDTLDKHPQWIRVLRLFVGNIGPGGEAVFPVVPGGALHLVQPVHHSRRIGIIGECRRTECNLFPPLDCYTCPGFQALPDPSVHERQLEQIIDELTAKHGHESDRMAVILKRAGLAISDLIERIDRRSDGVSRRAVAAQDLHYRREESIA